MPFTRREFMYVSSAAAAIVPMRGLLVAQTPGAPPQTSFETIRGNVGIFIGRGGTIGWLSNKDALIAVDSQYADTARICVDGLKQRGGRGIDILINTHHHGDHTGGNSVFKAEVKKIVAHARVPALMQEVAAGQKPGATPAAPPTVPDTTFEKAWTEKAGDEQVTARHYGPGHTGGDCVVHFQKANVVHMGDLLFLERHPRIDRPAGASIQNWIRTLEAVAKEFPADTVYIAGHAKQGVSVLTDGPALMKFRDYFTALLDYARREIKAGKPKEEIVKLAALPGFESYQAGGAMLSLAGSLDVAYDELTQK